MNKLKIGIVGLGEFANFFIPLFKMHPDVEKLVFADLDANKREEACKQYSINECYSSYDEMLDKCKDINCVAIFTQRHLHGPMILKALDYGKHVWCAAPLACTIEENMQIVEKVKETRLMFMTAETCYYFPCAVYCRKMYESGKMGKFVYGESQYYHDMFEFWKAFALSGGDNWRWSAGIPPMYYPTHSLSMIVSTTGEYAKKVSCMGFEDHGDDRVYGKGNNMWDNPLSNETAIFQMSGGGVARINEFRRVGLNKPSSYITCLYGTLGGYEGSVTQHTFQQGPVSGNQHIEYVSDLVNTRSYVRDMKAGKLDMSIDPIGERYHQGFAEIHDIHRLPKVFRELPDAVHYNSHPFLVDDFCRAVVSGKLPPNNVWDAARYMIPGIVAHESALKGGVLLDVPDCGNPPEDWERLTYEKIDYYE